MPCAPAAAAGTPGHLHAHQLIRMHADLFSPATLRKMCADVKITGDQHDAAREWLALLEGGMLQKEVPNYPIFIECMLGRILGYGVEDIKYESDNVEFQFYGSQRRPIGCFEVKGTSTKDLFATQPHTKKEHSTPIRQTWDYMGGIGLEYGVCTNYRTFVLITKKHGYSRHHLFDFERVRDDPESLREFIGVFSRERIGSGFVEQAHARSANEDRRLTDEFYDLYGRTRLMLIKEFESHGASRADAVASAQALLNRLVFIFFARDSGLAKDGDMFADGVIEVIGSSRRSRPSEHSRRVWLYMVEELFPSFDEGSAILPISGFSGGLFNTPFPESVQIMDLRPAEFFAEFKDKKRRRSWEFKEEIRAAIERHPGINPVIKNLLAMSSYDFKSQIRVTILGHIFEKSISELDDLLGLRASSRRKREGVFYTPGYVTRHICQSTIIPWLSKSGRAERPSELVAEYAGGMQDLEARLRAVKILDPACGSGAFLIEAASTLLDVYREIRAYKDTNGAIADGTLEPEIADASPLEIVRNNLYGMDINPQSAEITQLAMFLTTASMLEQLPDLSSNIVVRNSVANAAGGGWKAAFPRVFQGNGGFDIILGNPPYIRQEELQDKDAMALPDSAGLSLEPGFEIPRKSDLSSYFYYHSLSCLAEGGRLGFIASDGWLNHAYGLQLQRVLLDNCRIDALIRPTFNVFDDADIKTVVSLLTNTRPDTDHRTQVAAIRRPRDFDSWRGCVVAQRLQSEAAPGNWFEHFAGPTPGLKTPLTTVGAVGRVESCVKTGHNEFFVLTRDSIRDHSIPNRFRRPVLSDDIADGCLENKRATEYLLSVDLGKGQLSSTRDGKNVLHYIERAERTLVAPKKGASRTAKRIPNLSSLRGRDPWYSLGLPNNPPAAFLSIFTNVRIKVYRNNGRFFARNNFAALMPDVPAHTDALLAYLASSWFALHMEKNGHVAGGGALQFLIVDFERAPVPDLSRMPRSSTDRLGRIWNRYCDDLDRRRLDDAVLDVLGFSKAQRSSIARQLETLVSYRVSGSPDDGDDGDG